MNKLIAKFMVWYLDKRDKPDKVLGTWKHLLRHGCETYRWVDSSRLGLYHYENEICQVCAESWEKSTIEIWREERVNKKNVMVKLEDSKHVVKNN